MKAAALLDSASNSVSNASISLPLPPGRASLPLTLELRHVGCLEDVRLADLHHRQFSDGNLIEHLCRLSPSFLAASPSVRPEIPDARSRRQRYDEWICRP